MVAAFPPELELVRLSGSYVDFDGLPQIGTVRFEAKVPVLIATTSKEIVVPVVREVTLVNGEFVTDLPPTDDPDIENVPDSWRYTVTEVWANGRTYGMRLPSRMGPQNIADLSPLSTTTTLARGSEGPQGPPGDLGPGAQSGYFGVPLIGTDTFTVPIISAWGLRADGTAYYDPAGAADADAAILGYNSRGQLVLRKNDGALDPTVTGDVYEATSDDGMVALSFAKKGDRVRRLDQNRMYQLKAEPPATLGNWVADLYPIGGVSSVEGLTGEVSLAGKFVPVVDQRAVLPASGLNVPSSAAPSPETVPAAGNQFLYVDAGNGRLSWKDAAGLYGRMNSHLGDVTDLPSTAKIGDTARRTNIGANGCLFEMTGAGWRQAEIPEVATVAAMNAITNPFRGLQVFVTATQKVMEYQTTTTGWTPPWGQPWGFQGVSTDPTSGSNTGVNIGKNQSPTRHFLHPYQVFYQNRRYEFEFDGQAFCGDISARVGFITYVQVVDTPATGAFFSGPSQQILHGNQGRWDFIDVHYSAMWVPTTNYTAGAARIIAYTTYAGATAIYWDTVSPNLFKVNELGPTGAPA